MTEKNDMEFREQVKQGLKQVKPRQGRSQSKAESIQQPNNISQVISGNNNVTSLFGGSDNNINVGSFNYKPIFNYGYREPPLALASQEQAAQLRSLLEAAADWEERVCNHPKTYTQLCAELKEKFKFVLFETLPEEQFEHAIAYLERIIGRLALSQTT